MARPRRSSPSQAATRPRPRVAASPCIPTPTVPPPFPSPARSCGRISPSHASPWRLQSASHVSMCATSMPIRSRVHLDPLDARSLPIPSCPRPGQPLSVSLAEDRFLPENFLGINWALPAQVRVLVSACFPHILRCLSFERNQGTRING
eukprot:scaffold172_cov341-Pavlova_lutheri.AAC.22